MQSLNVLNSTPAIVLERRPAPLAKNPQARDGARVTEDGDNKQPAQQSGRMVLDDKTLARLQTANFPGDEGLASERQSSANLSAVNTYQHIDNLAKREQINQLFGVDLFA